MKRGQMMRCKIVRAVGSVLFCVVVLAGCNDDTTNRQQEIAASSVSVESVAQADTESSASKVSFDDEQAQKLRVQAEELFEESEYRKSSDTAKKAYDLSQNEEAYNSLIKKIIEALAKNCGFDNPQALRTTNIYGNMEWYLSCDGISGTPLEELPEEKIIEKFKEFRQNYHDTITPYGSLSSSFGNTTIGDFYCNGMWYDVHIDDAFGEKDYVTVYTDDEQHQKIAEAVEAHEARENMPSIPAGWTTGGPGVSQSTENSTRNTGNISQEYKNALETGLRYANGQQLSKDWVYKQLIHDGFSDGAAQYAVDNMGSVDWNGLALERAQRYYYSMSLSKEDVRKQLVHDGFTSSQAQYAVDNLH